MTGGFRRGGPRHEKAGVVALGYVLVALAWGGVCLSANLLAAETRPYKPEGELRWALYVTLSPSWFDPGEVVGLITPFWVLYALHDTVVKPMPGNFMPPVWRNPGR
jgi:hypothetical protein